MFIAWLERNWTQRRTRTAVIISLLIALLVFWLQHWGWFELTESKTLDWRYREFRAQTHLREDIVILDIDEESIKAMEQIWGRFPWPRRVHAEMLAYLGMAQAKAVAFDVLLTEPTQNPEVVCPVDGTRFRQYDEMSHPDYQLANATAMSGLTHHAMQFIPPNVITGTDTAVESLARFAIDLPPPEAGISFTEEYAVTAPLAILAENAAGVGAINVIPDTDGPVRRSFTFIRFKNKLYPSLSISVVLALASTPEHRATVRFTPEMIHIENPHFTVNGQTRPVHYRIPVDGGGRMQVHYYGGDHTYRYTPYYEIFLVNDPTTDLEAFRDRIVLIGSTASGLMDLRTSPFSSVYPGVEVHANLINNILAQDYLTWEPPWLLLVVLLALAGIMGLWVAPHRALEGALLTLLLAALYLVLVVTGFEHLNIALSLVAPLTFLGVDYIVLTGAGYMVEERKRRQVTGAFSQYVNPEVVKEILKDPEKLKLGGDKREISIFFSDLAGFTTIAEKLDSAVLVPLLNEYLTAMSDIILRYDGTVDKFIGDAVMAFWNAPLSQPDHAKRACWAAIEQLAKLDELRVKWLAEGYPEMNARAGINTGVVVVGNMGSRTLKNYTVIGDTINLGARLEPANKPYGTRLMISEFTYAQAKEFVEVRRLDAIQVKGKTRGIEVFELIAKKGELTPAQRELLAAYGEGMECYLNRRWEQGIAAFTAALKLAPEDGPSRLYVERCQVYRQEAPPDDWNGIFVMKTK